MGTKVTLVEYLPNIIPLEDEEVSKALARSFKREGIEIITEGNVVNVDSSSDLCKVNIETKQEIKTIEAEIVLSAVGISSKS